MKNEILETTLMGKIRVELHRNDVGHFEVIKIVNDIMDILFSSLYFNDAARYYEKKAGHI